MKKKQKLERLEQCFSFLEDKLSSTEDLFAIGMPAGTDKSCIHEAIGVFTAGIEAIEAMMDTIEQERKNNE